MNLKVPVLKNDNVYFYSALMVVHIKIYIFTSCYRNECNTRTSLNKQLRINKGFQNPNNKKLNETKL